MGPAALGYVALGAVVLGVPVAVTVACLLVDRAFGRQWNRERLLLGRDFAAVGLMIGCMNCLKWAREYLDGVRQTGAKSGLMNALAVPELSTLAVYLAVILFAGLVLLVVLRLTGQNLRERSPAPPGPSLSYGRIIAINTVGLLPLILAAALLVEAW